MEKSRKNEFKEKYRIVEENQQGAINTKKFKDNYEYNSKLILEKLKEGKTK